MPPGEVAADGVILTANVEITEGETVFSVLQRACSAFGIQPESGWMYKVNGWSPNNGCSAYTLTGGENIVRCYTCVGLGADVGA